MALKLVSENSGPEVAQRRAADKLRWPLKDLASNILRIIRGAGRSHELGKQAQGLVEAMIEYREIVGAYPSTYELDEILRIEQDHELFKRISEDSVSEEMAKHTITRGALQVVASKMLGQLTQQRAGETEMYDGMRRLEDLREERRKAYRREAAALRPKPRRKSRKAKAKLKPKTELPPF